MGFTLVDETSAWEPWAAHLAVPDPMRRRAIGGLEDIAELVEVPADP